MQQVYWSALLVKFLSKMRWLKVSEDVRQSDCGKFRITRHSKGFTSWLRHEGKKRTEWIRLEEAPFKTHAEAIKCCEQNKGEDNADSRSEPKDLKSIAAGT